MATVKAATSQKATLNSKVNACSLCPLRLATNVYLGPSLYPIFGPEDVAGPVGDYYRACTPPGIHAVGEGLQNRQEGESCQPTTSGAISLTSRAHNSIIPTGPCDCTLLLLKEIIV